MQKLDIFTCENNMLSSHVKISPLLWLHDKSRLSHQKTIKVKWFGISLVFIADEINWKLAFTCSYIPACQFATLAEGVRCPNEL